MPARREVVDRAHGRSVDVGELLERIRAREPRPDRAHAPRLANRRASSGHRDATEVPDALEPVEVGHQELAAPQRAVGPVAETVEGEPEHRFGATVLHHARGDVGVVVLHRHDRQVEVERELGRQVFRVEIVRDHLGTHAVQRGQMVDGLHERLVGREVLEVADVVAGDDVVARA